MGAGRGPQGPNSHNRHGQPPRAARSVLTESTMPRLSLLLEQHGIAILSAVVGVALVWWLWFLRAKGGRSYAGLILGTGCVLFAIGGFAMPREVGMYAAAACGVALFFAVLI